MFSERDTVYLMDGRKAEYIAAVGDDHLVRPVYLVSYGDEEYERTGDVAIAGEVFSSPPVAVYADDIEKLDSRAQQIRDEIAALSAELAQKKQANKEFLAQCAKYDQLRHLDDFINNRITHFVIKSSIGEISIKAKDAALDDGDRYDKRQKLLTLFGDTKGNLAWKLNRYRDGSGSDWAEVIPCLSEQHAREEAQKWVDALLADERNSYAHYTAKSALAIGLEVPARIVDKMKADRLAGKQLNYDRAVEAMKKAEADLLAEKSDAN